MYEEEARRNDKQDTRFDEKIARNERTFEINANIDMIINNFGEFAASASNMVTSNIDWSPNIPLELLRNIFENIVIGWNQTLYTAFEDRSLRIDAFKQMIMKHEVDICRNQSLFNALIENGKLVCQVLMD
jgi:hypothetical protein